MKHSEETEMWKRALQKRDAALVALFGLVVWCITHVPV